MWLSFLVEFSTASVVPADAPLEAKRVVVITRNKAVGWQQKAFDLAADGQKAACESRLKLYQDNDRRRSGGAT